MNKRVFTQSIRLAALSACVVAGGLFASTSSFAAPANCDATVMQRIGQANSAKAAFRQNAMQQVVTPPPAPSAVANAPCSATSMQNASNLFSSMPQQFMKGGTALAGQTSGTINQFFQSATLSLNEASRIIPSMLNFQSMASTSINNVITNLLGGAGFSAELCGLMSDVVMNFLQCQLPLQLPEFPMLGDLAMNSLNDAMNNIGGSGCSGNMARNLLYTAGATSSWGSLVQPTAGGLGSSITTSTGTRPATGTGTPTTGTTTPRVGTP